MVETDTSASDMAVGLGAVFVLVAAGASLVTYLTPGDPLSGWGFAAAMLAGALAVAAIHLYW